MESSAPKLERRLVERRSTSKLPQLIDLVMATPLVSASLIAADLSISSRAAQMLVGELGLREMTGRGRYRMGRHLTHASIA